MGPVEGRGAVASSPGVSRYPWRERGGEASGARPRPGALPPLVDGGALGASATAAPRPLVAPAVGRPLLPFPTGATCPGTPSAAAIEDLETGMGAGAAHPGGGRLLDGRRREANGIRSAAADAATESPAVPIEKAISLLGSW